MGYLKFKIPSIIILFLLLYIPVKAQISANNSKITISFRKDKIESDAHSIIFNILNIRNNSNSTFSGNINISVPRNWQLMGANDYTISIPANDSLSLPVRVSVSQNALGEIGYSVMANITNENGSSIQSSYFYITIPRKTELLAGPEKYVYYVSTYQNNVSIPYSVHNKGNIPELIHLEIKTDENLYIKDKNKNIYIEEFGLNANTDTIVSIPVFSQNVDERKSYSKLEIQSFNNDTTFFQTIWIKLLNDNYSYRIPENQKCAIVDFNAYNIFGSDNPNYNLTAKGAVLFKKKRELYYSFYSNFRKYEYSGINLGYFNNSFIGYKTSFTDTKIGFVQGNYEQSITGLGVDGELNIKKNQIRATYLRGSFSDYTAYGGSFKINAKRLNLLGGAIKLENRTYGINTKLGYAGTSLNFLKHNSFSVIVGGSELEGNNNLDVHQGYGINADYNLKLKKFMVSIRGKYGSPYYTGVFGGRTDIRAFSKYSFDRDQAISITYDRFYNSYFNYLQYDNANTRKSTYDRLQISYNKTVNKNIFYQLGLTPKIESVNYLYASNPDSLFEVISPGIFGLSNIHYDKITFEPRVEIYKSFIQRADQGQIQFNNSINTINLSLNIQNKQMGIYALFKYGPTSIFEHYIYTTNSEVLKWFFLMPYYKKYFFKKSLLLDIRGNYINNLNNNERTFNLNSQLFWYLPKEFTIRFQNTVYTRSRIDMNTNIKYSYSNMYFEMGIRKEFNCNQPRVQYHDLHVTFYRDINGDRKKNKNEPGISNVMAVIVKVYDKNIDETSNFNEIQFLSNEIGSIQYDNMQNGSYIIKYQLLNEIVGNFTLEQLEYPLEINEDKNIDIPFHEKNKIIGKVVMNRDPLSSMGNLSLANIRVTAEDTRGHLYSALTDKHGDFTLYTPVADYYKVKINNVFYESFNLQQTEFVVKFNGYKQFEVTFVFNEKKKQINFDNELDFEDFKLDDIKVIRKTTLTGKIRATRSLESVGAEIKIIDNKTNKVVSRVISNKESGHYSISYAAGTHFRIEVVARGYDVWVENLYIEQVISIQNINKDFMLDKEGANKDEQQKDFRLYTEKEDNFKENFKQGQQIPINYLTFALRETRLDPKSKPELDRLIDLLDKNKSVNVEIAGYSDDGGNARVEKMMALRRAKEVSKYLIMHGLPENRISVKSYGNTRPLVPGSSERAKAKNRRVEVIVR